MTQQKIRNPKIRNPKIRNPKIKVTGKTLPRVDPDEVAEALGAEPIDAVPVHKTTSASWTEEGHVRDSCAPDGYRSWDEDIPDPIIPGEPGKWKMVGSTATEGRVFWFWEKI